MEQIAPPPYEILGVSPSAAPEEVTAAYKVLAQIFHPDRFHGGPEAVRAEAEARMAALNEAYEAAQRGKLALSPSRSGSRPSQRPPRADPTSVDRQGRPGPGSRAWEGVAWWSADVDRAAQARKAEEARQARERAATNGQAVARPRRELSYSGSIMSGLGMARFTGNIVCRGCNSVQWLPTNWRQLLGSHAFFCSICNRPILSR